MTESSSFPSKSRPWLGPLVVALVAFSVAAAGCQNEEAVASEAEVTLLQAALNVEVPEVPRLRLLEDAYARLLPGELSRAEELVARAEAAGVPDIPDAERSLERARNSLESAMAEPDPLRATSDASSASTSARQALAYAEMESGGLTQSDVAAWASELEAETAALVDRIEYRGGSLEEVIVFARQIEGSVRGARIWVGEALQMPAFANGRSSELLLAGAASSLQRAENHLWRAGAVLELAPDGPDDHAGALGELYERLHQQVLEAREGLSYPEESYASSRLEGARIAIERAEENRAEGLMASAVLDLLQADALLGTLDALAQVPNPAWREETELAPEDIYSAVYEAKYAAVRALEQAMERAGGDPLALHRLQLAAADIETGDDGVRDALEYLGRDSLRSAHAIYAFAGAYADAVRPE